MFSLFACLRLLGQLLFAGFCICLKVCLLVFISMFVPVPLCVVLVYSCCISLLCLIVCCFSGLLDCFLFIGLFVSCLPPRILSEWIPAEMIQLQQGNSLSSEQMEFLRLLVNGGDEHS